MVWELENQWCGFQAVSEGQRTKNTEGRRRWCFSSSIQTANLSLLHFFVLFRASTDWMIPTWGGPSALLSANSNANLFWIHAQTNTSTKSLTSYLGILWPSQVDTWNYPSHWTTSSPLNLHEIIPQSNADVMLYIFRMATCFADPISKFISLLLESRFDHMTWAGHLGVNEWIECWAHMLGTGDAQPRCPAFQHITRYETGPSVIF